MKCPIVSIAALVIAALGSGCSTIRGDGGASASAADGGECSETQEGANLLNNPSFEDGTSLATGWTNESSTTNDPTYTLSTTAGVVDGVRSQRMQYAGTDGDDGTHKAQFFQAPINGVTPGETVKFSMCVSGDGDDALTKAYVIIGVESFRADGTYISDLSTNITEIDKSPTRYTCDYTVPDGAAYLAVFVQSPEFMDVSSIDLYFDHASLVVI